MPCMRCTRAQESKTTQHRSRLLGVMAADACFQRPCAKQLTLHAVVCAVGMEDIHMHATPPDNKDPNAPWYHMPANGLGEASSTTVHMRVPQKESPEDSSVA